MTATAPHGQSRPRRPRLLAALAATLLLGAFPAIAPAATPGAHAAASPASIAPATPAGAPRVELPAGGLGVRTYAAPAHATTTAISAAGDGRWLVGVRGERSRLRAVAARHGGRLAAALDVIAIPAERATALVAELGDDVRWAGPNRRAARAASFDTPAGESPWSRSVLAPPASGPLARIGLVDDLVDPLIPDLARVTQINSPRIDDSHGSMVASVAAAPRDGRGVVGVAPGAQVVSYGTRSLMCDEVADGITRLANRGVRVINVSLVFDYQCRIVEEAIAYAYTRRAIVVAASGNEREEGNALMYPASYPHVVTAAAVDASFVVPSFSNTSRFVDLAAPGVQVPVALQPAFDSRDGVKDGITAVDGTSFAAPSIAGALSWLIGARPSLSPSQAHALLRTTARDLGAPGWDAESGFGLAQIAPAIAAPSPAADPLEPNDEPWAVQASGPFAKRLLWSGGGAASLTATGDSADDPLDGYRIRIPARSRVTVKLIPTAGSVDLYAFNSGVRSFYRPSQPVAASTLAPGRTETLKLRNPSSKPKAMFIVAHSTDLGGTRAISGYRLELRKG